MRRSMYEFQSFEIAPLLMLTPWEGSARSQMARPVSLQLKLMKPDLRGVSASMGREDLKQVVVLPLPPVLLPFLLAFLPLQTIPSTIFANTASEFTLVTTKVLPCCPCVRHVTNSWRNMEIRSDLAANLSSYSFIPLFLI